MSIAERAHELLRHALGQDAKFHPGQLEAIVALVQDRARVLVIQPTGWGKSIVYLIATALLRERERGPTILISPLLALMRDQPQQKTMQNSYHQARNALDSFAAIPESVISEPVLLVDDMVDSRWSLTVCGVLLAEADSGPVVPVALAESTAKGQE